MFNRIYYTTDVNVQSPLMRLAEKTIKEKLVYTEMSLRRHDNVLDGKKLKVTSTVR